MTAKKKLILLLSIAFVVKVGLILYLKTYANPVKMEFEDLVNSLLSGHGYVYNFLGTPYRSFNTPLYSFICAGIYIVTGHSFLPVLILQSAATIILAYTVYMLANMMFDRTVSVTAAACVAFHPGFMYYDIYNLVPLSIDSSFIAAVTFLFLRYRESLTVSRMLIIGFLIGLGTFSRGIIGAMLPYLSAYIVLFVKNIRFREKLKLITVCAAAVMIVLLPWIIRNYVVHREFVFIATTNAECLYRGNNPTALGTSLTGDGRCVRELWPDDVKARIETLDEMGQKRYFEREAVRFIVENPVAFLKLYLRKIYYFWWFSHQSGSIYPGIYLRIYKIAYSMMVVFYLAGLVLTFRNGGRNAKECTVFMLIMMMSVCLSQSLFYVEGRHRWLIEPLLLIYFSYGLVSLLRSVKMVFKGTSGQWR